MVMSTGKSACRDTQGYNRANEPIQVNLLGMQDNTKPKLRSERDQTSRLRADRPRRRYNSEISNYSVLHCRVLSLRSSPRSLESMQYWLIPKLIHQDCQKIFANFIDHI